MSARFYNVAIGLVACAIVVLLAWPRLNQSFPQRPQPRLAATDAATTSPTPPEPLTLEIHSDGVTIGNRTSGPLDNCFIEILGGFVAQVPIIPAHGSVNRNFIVLFDSEDHEAQAHMAGQTFQEFMLDNARTKTSVSCQDIDNHRVATIFHPMSPSEIAESHIPKVARDLLGLSYGEIIKRLGSPAEQASGQLLYRTTTGESFLIYLENDRVVRLDPQNQALKWLRRQ